MQQLHRLRSICLRLPEAFEQAAWGEATFRVRKEIFAMHASPTNHHGAGREGAWCKAPLGVQEMLVRSAPDRFFIPPYVGVKGWIGIDLEQVDDVELAELVLQSYCMVAPAKLRRALADQATGGPDGSSPLPTPRMTPILVRPRRPPRS